MPVQVPVEDRLFISPDEYVPLKCGASLLLDKLPSDYLKRGMDHVHVPTIQAGPQPMSLRGSIPTEGCDR